MTIYQTISYIDRVPTFLTWQGEMNLAAELRPNDCGSSLVFDADGQEPAPAPMDQTFPYSIQETGELRVKLASALGIVDMVSKPARRLIDDFLRIVLLRKSVDRGSFSSSSWPRLPGALGVVNADRADVALPWLAETMVHEAIHALLYAIERVAPFYDAVEEGVAHKARSPWSGRTLLSHSYVHACFVWFGLWSFWRLARSQSISNADTRFLEERALSGFKPNLLTALGPGEQSIRPEVRDAVKLIEKKVMSLTRHQEAG